MKEHAAALNSKFDSNFLNADAFPIPYIEEVESHPVNACKNNRFEHISFPNIFLYEIMSCIILFPAFLLL